MPKTRVKRWTRAALFCCSVAFLHVQAQERQTAAVEGLPAPPAPSSEYRQIQAALAQGWNTLTWLGVLSMDTNNLSS